MIGQLKQRKRVHIPNLVLKIEPENKKIQELLEIYSLINSNDLLEETEDKLPPRDIKTNFIINKDGECEYQSSGEEETD